MRKNLVVLCGGPSAEHDISLMSARFVAQNVALDHWRCFVVGLTHDKHFKGLSIRDQAAIQGETDLETYGQATQHISLEIQKGLDRLDMTPLSIKSYRPDVQPYVEQMSHEQAAQGQKTHEHTEQEQTEQGQPAQEWPALDQAMDVFFAHKQGGAVLKWGEQEFPVDCLFPCMHGPLGEDGSIQGWAQVLGIPYVGSAVLGSAVGMDKIVCKQILQGSGLPVAPFTYLGLYDQPMAFQDLVQKFSCDQFFIKPSNMGSSVGISKVQTPQEYDLALEKARLYDARMIIEVGLDARDLECAVLETPGGLQASGIGEIVLRPGEFYDYVTKYIKTDQAHILTQAQDLTPTEQKTIQDLALAAFRVLNCQGLARVDFFMTPDRKIYINEINTMPGFTPHSLYPKLWQEQGISASGVVSALIDMAFIHHRQRQNLLTKPDIDLGTSTP